MTTQERLKILEMIAGGKLTAEEGARLLDASAPPAALDVARIAMASAPSLPKKSNGAQRHLRVKVVEGSGTRVNINLPLSLMEVGLRIGGRFVDELKDFEAELALLMEAVRNDMTGKIVEVDDEDSHVEIYIE